MPHNPAIGFPWTLAEVPPELVGRGGWIDAGSMRDHVFKALAQSVGGVAPAGQGSFDVTTWVDVEGSGRRVHISSGEWNTAFVATPDEARECLKAAGVDASELSNFAERRVRLRYWTERGRGVPKPGEIDLQVAVYARAGADEAEQRVVLPKQIECMVKDLLERL